MKKARTRENRCLDYYNCPIIGTPCAKFIQWCDEYQERENNRFQRPRNDIFASPKREGEDAEIKQYANIHPFCNISGFTMEHLTDVINVPL